MAAREATHVVTGKRELPNTANVALAYESYQSLIAAAYSRLVLRCRCSGNATATFRPPARAVVQAQAAASRQDQPAVLNRDENTPLTLSVSFTLQAVRSASRLICVALRFVFRVL